MGRAHRTTLTTVMTSRDFCYWLQGFFEVTDPAAINNEQTDMIKRHLNLVFKHEIDLSMPDPTGELQETHDGKPPSPGDVILRC